MSVSRINKMLRFSGKAKAISAKAPLFIAGAMEKVVDSLVKGAVDNARAGLRNSHGGLLTKRIDLVDVIHAVRSDPDLARMALGFAFSSNSPSAKPVKYILSSDAQKKRSNAKKLRQEAKGAALVARDSGLD